jgi:MFS family permease
MDSGKLHDTKNNRDVWYTYEISMSKKRFSLQTILNRNGSATPREPLPPLTYRIFALAFATDFMVIYPFYVIMFGERGDVSAAGVGVLLASWMITSLLAEVPTGIIADSISKKWSLVMCQLLQMVAFACWLFFPTFAGYLAGFIIWGIAGAFNSGAFQAYLYESLDEPNKKAFGKIYSRSNAFTMLATMLGSLVAFGIGPNYTLLLVLSVVCSGVALHIALSLPTTRNVQVAVAPLHKPKVFRSAVKAIHSQPILQQAVFIAVILFGLMGMIAEYLPAYYQHAGTPTNLVPLLISIGSACAALLYWWMHHVEAQLAKHGTLIVTALTILFIVVAQGGAVLSVVAFFIFTRLLRIVTVSSETQVQHLAPENARATVASFYSFLGKILAAAMLGLIGFFAVNGNITIPLQWSVAIMVALLVVGKIYFGLRHKASGHN